MEFDFPVLNGLKVTGFYLREPMMPAEYVPGLEFYPNGVVLVPVISPGDDGSYRIRWKINVPGHYPGQALNREGEWEFENMPSERTAGFLDRCRFDSVDDALVAWRAFEFKEPERIALRLARREQILRELYGQS